MTKKVNKKVAKKITLEDLMAKKLQKDTDKIEVKMYNSKEFGGEIQVIKIPLKKYMGLMNDVEDGDMEDNLDFMSEVIFECCPIFKENSKQLMETFEVEDALELPLILLNDNMGEMNAICEIVNSFYGLGKVKEKVKN
ncbi:hypothetical protein [Clostridium tagluense]|uniref:hypothetical protein n=1 Tax=Clostridium tagluense TaxID=360422 RepID=UPI001C6E71C3|nr:hypothetical protein [Clostridium tagluense]MBW9154859.1 hypothetical protein [Clostridium tagluense]WLC64314.1 hypothetical protein KTC93_15745 [Clostridium tagluense]